MPPSPWTRFSPAMTIFTYLDLAVHSKYLKMARAGQQKERNRCVVIWATKDQMATIGAGAYTVGSAYQTPASVLAQT